MCHGMCVVKRQGMARRLRRVPNAAAARVNGGRAIYEAAVGGRGDAPWRLALIISLARVSLCMSREPSYLLDPACRRTVSLVSTHSVSCRRPLPPGPLCYVMFYALVGFIKTGNVMLGGNRRRPILLDRRHAI